MPGKAPVEAVGGTQSEGPWPEHVEEIVEGGSYTRPVGVITEVRCTAHDPAQTFDTRAAARTHCDTNHGGDYSSIEVEVGRETRDVTVASIVRHGRRDDPDEDGYTVTLDYDPDPVAGGGA